MHLSDFDLQQLDEARLSELTAAQKELLLKKLVSDLKAARERLKADSRTSSRPPSRLRGLSGLCPSAALLDTSREGPAVDLRGDFHLRLETFRRLCQRHRDSGHDKTRALAREFVNDWEAIWTVLAHPPLPLTNNEAERLLRHWVILRRTSYGTRTEQGSRAMALLASVIETCRKRHVLPWPYLAQVIAQRRQGRPAPPLT